MTNDSRVCKLFFKNGRSESVVCGREQRVDGNSQLMNSSRMAMVNDSTACHAFIVFSPHF